MKIKTPWLLQVSKFQMLSRLGNEWPHPEKEKGGKRQRGEIVRVCGPLFLQDTLIQTPQYIWHSDVAFLQQDARLA